MKANHLTAIIAAIKWLYPSLPKREFVMEVAWAMQEVVLDSDDNILWRSFSLGKKLFQSLGEVQNWRCCYCFSLTTDQGHHMGTLEHVVRKTDGGLDHPDNLVMACKKCNNERCHQPQSLI